MPVWPRQSTSLAMRPAVRVRSSGTCTYMQCGLEEIVLLCVVVGVGAERGELAQLGHDAREVTAEPQARRLQHHRHTLQVRLLLSGRVEVLQHERHEPFEQRVVHDGGEWAER